MFTKPEELCFPVTAPQHCVREKLQMMKWLRNSGNSAVRCSALHGTDRALLSVTL